ncbi:glutathione S-transferase family protein [Rhodobacteraceae bacterium D3-12]|nr:glutathione S-transferase family protein [Rhodobacteraceae bacterium D3-12]
MSLVLHLFSGAPTGWRVHLGLTFKNLAADIRRLSNDDKDQLRPEFLAISPRAKAPVLETETGVVRDSIAILAWLDRAYPENPLFGSTPAQASEIWQITMECCEYLRAANHQLLSRVFPSDGSMPSEGSTERDALQLGAKMAHAECRYLEDILSDGRLYLGGDVPSAADAVAFPEIRLLQRGVETKHALMSAFGFGNPPETYPHTASWKARLNEDPRIAATLPPHWGETPQSTKPAA